MVLLYGKLARQKLSACYRARGDLCLDRDDPASARADYDAALSFASTEADRIEAQARLDALSLDDRAPRRR